MDFNNREIATLVWSVIVVAAVFVNAPVRSAVRAMLRAMAHRALLLIFAVAALYVAACVAFLAWWEIWTVDNIKSTAAWLLAFVPATLFNANRIDEDRTYFGRTIRDTLSLTGLLVFIGGLQSFSLPVELVIIPLMTFLALMHQVSERDVAHAPATRFLGTFLAIVGFAVLAYSIYATFLEWPKFDVRKNVSELLVPILLSLLFLPFLYCVSVVIVYDRNFGNIAYALPDKGLARFARQRAFFAFRGDLGLLKRWRHIIMHRRPTDRLGVVQAIAQAQREKERAERRPDVDPADGWSPYVAMEFLASEGFTLPGYLWYFDRYRASFLHKFGDRPLANHATYYVEGNEAHAMLLTLELWMWGPDNKEEDEPRFAKLIAMLMDRAVGPDAVAAFRGVLDENHQGVSLKWNGYIFAIESDEPGPSGQFSVSFTIAHPAEPRDASDDEALRD